MSKHLKILTSEYLTTYSNRLSIDWYDVFNTLRTKGVYSKEDFIYYVQSAATFSSNIEGNSIDIDTYLKNKMFNIKSKPKETKEIDDLVSAYNFAIKNKLTLTNILKAHKILSHDILDLPAQRGKFRTHAVGVIIGRSLEYEAIEHWLIKDEMLKLFSDIDELISRNLSQKEIFYYASMIHLIFEKIHPFADGNGRAGRLLEKWFLSEKVGKNAWSVQSEQYYSKHKLAYYKNIQIGRTYHTVSMDKCVPFLLMLPKALQFNKHK